MYYPNTGYMPNRYQMPQQQLPQMMQQQFPQIPQQMCGLKGRLVSSLDEVKAIAIDMDGSETYFPHPASNSIYTKSIDNSGNSVIKHYVLEENASPKIDPVKEELDGLKHKLEDLESLKNEIEILAEDFAK